VLCLMQDLVARVPRDWALEASVLESSDQRDLHL
jgi:hypothetical protein